MPKKPNPHRGRRPSPVKVTRTGDGPPVQEPRRAVPANPAAVPRVQKPKKEKGK